MRRKKAAAKDVVVSSEAESRTLDAAEEMPRLELSEEYVVDPTGKRLAERLRTARQSRKLTLDALSLVTKAVDPEKRGISRMSLSRYEAGADPGVRELRLLSQALRRSLAALVYGQSEDPLQVRRPSWEELIQREIWEMLVAHKLVKDEDSLDKIQERYEAVLEAARKLAKE